MVKAVWQFLSKETKGVHEAAYLLAAFTFLSQLLGLLRDRLFAATFGAGSELDVYYSAFRVPDLIFTTVASLVSVSVLVPFLIRLRESGEADVDRKLMDSIFAVFVFGMGFIISLAWILMPKLLSITAPGITDPHLLPMARVLLLSPFILGLSNLCGSMTQAKRRFIAYAMSPVLYNLGIIVGVVFFYREFGLYGLAYGVVLGSSLHLLIQLPSVLRYGVLPRMRNISWKLVREVFELSLPRTLTLGMNHLVMIALVSVASLMTVGSISVFTFASNLQSVPLALIGVSYSLAAFPLLAELYSKGKKEEFIEHVISPMKQVLFWSIPITVMFIVLRAQIVRTILGTGAFDWNDTRLTAAVCAIFVVSICAQNISLLLTRAYYASGFTRKPFFFALWGAIVAFLIVIFGGFITHSGMAWYFIESLFRVSGLEGTEVLILPIAFSLGAITQAFMLWKSFSREHKGFSMNFERPIFQSLGASVIGGFVTYQVLDILDDFLDLSTTLGVFLQGFVSGIAGIIVIASLLYSLQNNEIMIVLRTIRSKIWKAKPIAEDVHEVV